MKYLILFLCLLLPGCGLYSNLSKAAENAEAASEKVRVRIDQVDAVLTKVEAKVEAVKSDVKSATQAADKNGDGSVSGFNEWILLIGALGAAAWKQLSSSDQRRRETIKEIFGQLDSVKSQLPSYRPPPL